jgi:ankyrin repeat domain-containing protein 50
MREDLYSRRYELKSSDQDRKAFLPSHIGYRDTLKELYTQILKFQAVSICYYSKNAASRVIRDTVKWDNWDSLLADIRTQEMAFQGVNKLWKDTKYEEDCIASNERHQESIKRLDSIGRDLSNLRKAIEEAQKDTQRRELLSWLSSIDPSENYNSARDRHEAETGSWLVQCNRDFEHWETDPNSLLWLHGKGMTILS